MLILDYRHRLRMYINNTLSYRLMPILLNIATVVWDTSEYMDYGVY